MSSVQVDGIDVATPHMRLLGGRWFVSYAKALTGSWSIKGRDVPWLAVRATPRYRWAHLFVGPLVFTLGRIPRDL